jgi:hypothetical protein
MTGMKHTSMEILIGDDESQTENEILIALPCLLVKPYLGSDFSHTFRRTAGLTRPRSSWSSLCNQGRQYTLM